MCDTFVALPPATKDGSVVFAKNSDRPAGEAQGIRTYPAARHAPGARLACTYIEIPQAPEPHAVLLSQIGWMWGAEMGANDAGVVIGNEAVWTRERLGPPALLGMDLVRLGLERGATADRAVDVIVELLETHGQGGACAENDPGFTYHNSFLVADAREAWVLETADRTWAAERVAEGWRNISNGLTIRVGYDKASKAVREARPRPDFAATFAADGGGVLAGSRQDWGTRLLAAEAGRITPETMMDLLADHDSGICMHGAFETTASMVSELFPDGRHRHWMTGRPHPCRTRFEEVAFPSAEAAE